MNLVIGHSTAIWHLIDALQPEVDLRTVVNAADRGLYQAKSAGRNCIQWISVEQPVSEEARDDTT